MTPPASAVLAAAPRTSDAAWPAKAWPLVAIVVVLAAFVVTSAPVVIAAWSGRSSFQDDAFYYLVTANHFVDSGRFTFDGVTATNGFQPLWMVLVVLVTRLLGLAHTPERQVFAVTLLEQACLLAALAIALRGFAAAHARRNPWAAAYLALCAFLLFPPYFIFRQGMETTLAVALLVLALYWFDTGRALAMGFALAALFLTRLDAGVFVVAPLLAWTSLSAGPPRPRSLAPAVPFAVAFAAYAALNVATTGHVVPISGALKSSFPALRFQPAFFTEPLAIAAMVGWPSLAYGINVVLAFALVAAGFVALAFPQPRRARLAGVGVVALLVTANLLLFQKWDKSIDPRYLALPVAAALFFAVAALSCALRGAAPAARFGPFAGTALAALLVACLGWEGAASLRDFHARATQPDRTRDLFRDVRRALPADAVLAGTDVGALAFWTGLRVVNLDGVISDFRYQAYLRDGRLRDYLREQRVTHVATGLWDRAQAFTGRPVEPMYRSRVDPRAERGEPYGVHRYYVYSYLYGVYSDVVPLHQSDEVFRRALGEDGVARVSYVVYLLR
jgi:hypothetical protein